MTILITGALGHISSRLIRELPNQWPKANIILVDNLLTQRYSSLFNLPLLGRYRFIQADILTADLGSLLKDVDVVIHLAAITDATASFSNQADIEKTNYDGTVRVAQACAKTGTALFFVSTTSIYGANKPAVEENCEPSDIQPQSPYAQSKLEGERMIAELGKTKGLRYTLVRFGTIFGTSPGMRFHTAVNKFCWQAVMNLPITVWKTAFEQVRPYLDLHDAVRAMMFLINQNRWQGDLYNVVTLNTSVKDIIATIQTLIPTLQVEFVDTKIMNQFSYGVSTKKIEQQGFTFEGDLKKAVTETITLLKQAHTF